MLSKSRGAYEGCLLRASRRRKAQSKSHGAYEGCLLRASRRRKAQSKSRGAYEGCLLRALHSRKHRRYSQSGRKRPACEYRLAPPMPPVRCMRACASRRRRMGPSYVHYIPIFQKKQTGNENSKIV